MAVICLLISAVLIGIDQLTKYLVVQNIETVSSGFEVIKGFFEITYLENYGAALGLLQNQQWIFIPLTIVGVLVLLIFLFKYKRHNFWSYATISLIIAGGIGNFIDRIAHTYVVDFIHISFFPYIFNFADCCVVVGAVMMVITVIKSSLDERRRDRLSGITEADFDAVIEENDRMRNGNSETGSGA